MSARTVLCSLLLLAPPGAAHGEDFLDRVDEALTFSGFEDRARVRLSGTLDLEYYHITEPPFGLVNSTANDLFNPRLTFFLDAQFGPRIYVFSQARLDRGYDPGDGGAQVRLDEYALRITPWEDGRFILQAGKFATVIGNWVPRHLSWDNPFVTAPLPYEHVTNVSDLEPPASAANFVHGFSADETYEYNPVLWGAAYTSGLSLSGLLGKFEYAMQMTNAAPSSRPDSWDATAIGFDYPTFSGRLGWRPSATWNLGFSASGGPYLRPEAEPMLPPGRGLGDYGQFLLGQDISFAWRHLQIWAEFYQARFEVPRVGNADTFAYYLEAKYKFSPEFFAALRWNQQLFADVSDGRGGETPWGSDLWRADAALGYRFTPHTQLKLQYSLENDSGPRGQSHALAVQFTVKF